MSVFFIWYLCICFLIILQKRWHSRPPGLGLECSIRSVLLGPSQPPQPQSLLIFFHWQLVGLGVQDLDLVLVPFLQRLAEHKLALTTEGQGSVTWPRIMSNANNNYAWRLPCIFPFGLTQKKKIRRFQETKLCQKSRTSLAAVTLSGRWSKKKLNRSGPKNDISQKLVHFANCNILSSRES